MTDQTVINLVVQAGAVGIAIAIIWWIGRRIDKVVETLVELVGEIRTLVQQHRDGHDRPGGGGT